MHRLTIKPIIFNSFHLLICIEQSENFVNRNRKQKNRNSNFSNFYQIIANCNYSKITGKISLPGYFLW